MDPKEIAAIAAQAARDVVTAKNAEDEIASLKNEIGELRNVVTEMAKNMVKNAPPTEEKKPVEGENAEGKEKKPVEGENADEPATLENAKPAQKVIAAFASAYNTEWKRGVTPGFDVLASLAGITDADPAARIAAVNAKFAELEGAKATAGNTAGKAVAVGGVF